MLIRTAAEQDIPGILELLLQVCRVHHQIRPDIFREGGRKYTAQELLGILSDESKPIFIADDRGSVAGYCFCQIRNYAGEGALTPRRELYIDDLCVDESRRGQHIGTALFRHTEDFAKSIGCRFLTLNVWQGNDSAMAFYQDAGLTRRSSILEKPLC